MDIDGDDALIGKQVFNLYNHIYYNNPDAWFVYSNFLAVNGSANGDGRGISHDMSNANKGKMTYLKYLNIEFNSIDKPNIMIILKIINE